MYITNTEYKNKQGIHIVTDNMKCIILPDGGKMVSLKLRSPGGEREMLAQAPGKGYIDLTPGGSYVDSECSAFDDMFPTIDPWESPERPYPDHGEVCRMQHTYEITNGPDGLALCTKAESPYGDYIFRKKYTEYREYGNAAKVPADRRANGIRIEYEVKNTSSKPLKAIWASHMMLRAEIYERVKLDEGIYTGELMFFDRGTDSYEDNGECIAGSIADSIAGSMEKGTGLIIQNGSRLLMSGRERNAYKFYIKEPYRGYFTYGDISVKCEGTDYLGIWMNNGAFKNMYNVAAEFCTGAYDTPGNAEKRGADVTVPAGETKKWKMIILRRNSERND